MFSITETPKTDRYREKSGAVRGLVVSPSEEMGAEGNVNTLSHT